MLHIKDGLLYAEATPCKYPPILPTYIIHANEIKWYMLTDSSGLFPSRLLPWIRYLCILLKWHRSATHRISWKKSFMQRISLLVFFLELVNGELFCERKQVCSADFPLVWCGKVSCFMIVWRNNSTRNFFFVFNFYSKMPTRMSGCNEIA